VSVRIRNRLAGERGYSLVELLTVVTILSVVVGALTTLFVGASKGELDMNRRFQAQQNARLAMDKLRREVHCATSVALVGASPSSGVTITIPGACPTAQGATSIMWCVLPTPGGWSGQYALYRSTAGTCTTANGVKWADYLTSPSIFTYTAQSSLNLASLGLALSVRAKQSGTQGLFTLSDNIVLRNSSRTCITGSPSPPC
jgi:prepilin-type N-terminal cleavage/methylation domain-containing protein